MVANAVSDIISSIVKSAMLYMQGRAVKFHQPENNMSCALREKIFCSGVGEKCSGEEVT